MPMKGWTQDDVDHFNAAKAAHAKAKHTKRKQSMNAMPPLAKPKRKAKVGKGAQVPNKTEAEYAKLFLAGTDHRFQALTFQMKNGLSYTADWIVFDLNGVPYWAIECKGSHRFHSQGRARLAFSQCVIEYAGIKFTWATKTKEGWVHE